MEPIDFRKYQPKQTIEEKEGSLISFEERKDEIDSRKEYEDLEGKKRFVKQTAQRLLNGERLTRRSPTFGGDRDLPLTHSFVAQNLDALEQQQKALLGNMGITMRKREDGKTVYEGNPRSLAWLRKKRFIT